MTETATANLQNTGGNGRSNSAIRDIDRIFGFKRPRVHALKADVAQVELLTPRFSK